MPAPAPPCGDSPHAMPNLAPVRATLNTRSASKRNCPALRAPRRGHAHDPHLRLPPRLALPATGNYRSQRSHEADAQPAVTFNSRSPDFQIASRSPYRLSVEQRPFGETSAQEPRRLYQDSVQVNMVPLRKLSGCAGGNSGKNRVQIHDMPRAMATNAMIQIRHVCAQTQKPGRQ